MTSYNICLFQKIMNCYFTLSYITQDADIQGFQFNCDTAVKEASLVRVNQTLKRMYLWIANEKVLQTIHEE